MNLGALVELRVALFPTACRTIIWRQPCVGPPTRHTKARRLGRQWRSGSFDISRLEVREIVLFRRGAVINQSRAGLGHLKTTLLVRFWAIPGTFRRLSHETGRCETQLNYLARHRRRRSGDNSGRSGLVNLKRRLPIG